MAWQAVNLQLFSTERWLGLSGLSLLRAQHLFWQAMFQPAQTDLAESCTQLLCVDDGCCVAARPTPLGLHRLLHLIALLGVGGVEGQGLCGCNGMHGWPLISPTPAKTSLKALSRYEQSLAQLTMNSQRAYSSRSCQGLLHHCSCARRLQSRLMYGFTWQLDDHTRTSPAVMSSTCDQQQHSIDQWSLHVFDGRYWLRDRGSHSYTLQMSAADTGSKQRGQND